MASSLHIAIVTGRFVSHEDEDQAALSKALEAEGARASVVAWNDDDVDWSIYDLAVIRSAWDYTAAVDDFRTWAQEAARVTRLLNPITLVEWNSDKHYLGELASRGVPVVPTTYLEPGAEWSVPSLDEYVLKPGVSAASDATARFRRGADDDAARSHAETILSPGASLRDVTLRAGRALMVQPYLPSVATVGETSLVFVGGELSHVVRKTPALAFGSAGLSESEYFAALVPAEPSTEQLAVAKAAPAAIPFAEAPLYARVDVVPDDDGRVLLLELELIEPSLYLHAVPGSVDNFARVLAQAARTE